MKKKYIVLLFFAIVLIVVLFLIIFNLSKDYKLEYKVDGYVVKEEYNKELKFYRFSLEHEKNNYEIIVNNKYIRDRELIDNIETYEVDDTFCVLLKSDKFATYPACSKGDDYIDYGLLEKQNNEFYEREQIKIANETFKNLEIHSTTSKNLLIWAHKGYYYINDEVQKEILFLEKESYYNSLAFQVDEYVITPNYDEEYSFSSVYVINLKNGKVKTWNFDYEISYNSYFLGFIDKLGYLVDRKNKIEYSFDPSKEKIEVVSKDGTGIVWHDRWEEVSMTKLASVDYKFESTEIYSYILDSKQLKLTHYKNENHILLSSQKVDKIVNVNKDEVAYLAKDKLYIYSPFKGENQLIKYSEWEFNDMNAIFIY